MKTDRALQMLGLAMRAGAVQSGGFMTENCVKDGSAFLVVVAADASDNTRKDFSDMCSYYGVPIRFYKDREVLGHCIGREFRASLAVTDEGLAAKIIDLIDMNADRLDDRNQ